MVYLLFVLGAVLTVCCWRKKRELETTQKTNTPAFFFTKNGLFFLVPFTSVASFYILLGACFSFVDQDSTTLHTLYLFEKSIHFLRTLVCKVKLTTWQSLVGLTVLFVLAMIGILLRPQPSSRRDTTFQKLVGRASHVFSRYSRVVSISYLAFTLLCSFTFFASSVDSALGRLQLRIKNVEEKTVEIGAHSSQIFHEEVINSLLEQVIEQVPPDFDILRQKDISLELEEHKLREKYQEAKSRFHIQDREVEKILQRHVERLAERHGARLESLQKIDEIAQKAQRKFQESENLVDIAAKSRVVTTEKLRDIEEELNSYEKEVTPKFLTIAEDGVRKKLTAKTIEALLTTGRKIVIPVFEDFPLSESIMKVFDKVLSDIVTRSIEAEVIQPCMDRLAKKIAKGEPGGLKASIQSEAAEFVEQEGGVAKAWKEYVTEDHVEYEVLKGELSMQIQDVTHLRSELLAKMEATEKELIKQREDLLLKIDPLFDKLANSESFLEGSREWQYFVGLSRRERSPRFSKEEVAVFLAQTLERYQQISVSVSQIVTLERCLTILQTLHHNVPPTEIFSDIQNLVSEHVGIAKVKSVQEKQRERERQQKIELEKGFQRQQELQRQKQISIEEAIRRQQETRRQEEFMRKQTHERRGQHERYRSRPRPRPMRP